MATTSDLYLTAAQRGLALNLSETYELSTNPYKLFFIMKKCGLFCKKWRKSGQNNLGKVLVFPRSK
jgi:hypothetical protein